MDTGSEWGPREHGDGMGGEQAVDEQFPIKFNSSLILMKSWKEVWGLVPLSPIRSKCDLAGARHHVHVPGARINAQAHVIFLKIINSIRASGLILTSSRRESTTME